MSQVEVTTLVGAAVALMVALTAWVNLIVQQRRIDANANKINDLRVTAAVHDVQLNGALTSRIRVAIADDKNPAIPAPTPPIDEGKP